ncbi:outer membrane lipoprotein-sorting protein [Marinilabilia rubra]|uniref:Outer membrane lipoprotein-sorting protein n=1 Tax=Marinilabilia rubra TaxID=2162893 RepID=A0A2U2B9G3_9BACT|nr:outer membrane lipoprotein-sorting protein [Marinilabilia rubra]PWD99676.1 outer membrane lipoprotein-sorting protein [Marinilabilia rubra]
MKTQNSSSKRTFSLMILFCIGMLLPANAQNLSGKEIVKKADDLMRGKSNYAEVEMEIIRPTWTRTLRFKSWAKGDDYSLVYITYPQREKGQRFLKRDREMWNYVPSIDRMIKIPPSMMMQSWMGSDLTNDDLVNAASILEDYDQTVLRTENLRGSECYVINMIPHEEAPVVWGKVVTWISKNDFITLRNEYYDEAGVLVNEEILDETEDAGDRTIPTRFTMIPADKEGHKTIMKFQNIEFGVDINDSFFSIQNMKRMR